MKTDNMKSISFVIDYITRWGQESTFSVLQWYVHEKVLSFLVGL